MAVIPGTVANYENERPTPPKLENNAMIDDKELAEILDPKNTFNFDETKLKPFEAEVERMTIVLNDDIGDRFNQLAKILDIHVPRLCKEAMQYFCLAYEADPDFFEAESKRAHVQAAQAMIFAAKDMAKRKIGRDKPAAKGEGYTADRIHESEVKDDE